MAVPSTASPTQEIVLFGAHSGSHLTVTIKDGKIVVKGMMAHSKPVGCHLSASRIRATCPLSAAALEIDMGPENDFVVIADPLPILVTAHLGAGSDKFIGNDEPDTASRSERLSLDGCPVLLQQLDIDQRGAEVIATLAERFEVQALDQEQLLFRVTVDDARFPDEAVVRLASALDEIDADWQSRFGWPKRLD